MKKLGNILIVILIIVGVVFIQHEYFPTKSVTLKVERDTLYQDTGRTEYIPKPYPVYIDTIIYDSIKIPLDSTELVTAYKALYKDFNSTYGYIDTIVNDSLLFLRLETAISNNQPILYKPKWYIKKPFIINNTIITPTKNELYVGLDVGKNNITPNILFKSKKSYIFGVGYNIQNNGIVFKTGMNINKIKTCFH